MVEQLISRAEVLEALYKESIQNAIEKIERLETKEAITAPEDKTYRYSAWANVYSSGHADLFLPHKKSEAIARVIKGVLPKGYRPLVHLKEVYPDEMIITVAENEEKDEKILEYNKAMFQAGMQAGDMALRIKKLEEENEELKRRINSSFAPHIRALKALREITGSSLHDAKQALDLALEYIKIKGQAVVHKDSQGDCCGNCGYSKEPACVSIIGYTICFYNKPTPGNPDLVLKCKSAKCEHWKEKDEK